MGKEPLEKRFPGVLQGMRQTQEKHIIPCTQLSVAKVGQFCPQGTLGHVRGRLWLSQRDVPGIEGVGPGTLLGSPRAQDAPPG